MKEVKTQIEMVAYSDAPVFLMGESGTGKELISESIHNSSERSKNPYLKVNCAAIPKDLIESTLFGHEKGAFTGALKQHKGLFEESNSGTLLLDEISEMPLPMQTKLLRILQEGTLTRVGSNKEIKVDVRVLATSNRKIYEEIDKGNFREDLFYRLNVFPINIPPLRERKEDIPLLVNFFISDILNKYNDADKPLDQSAMNKLINYSWPGNIRELRNIVERAYLLSKNDNEILSKHFILENTASLKKSKNISSQDPITIAEMEKELIYNALERLGDNRNKAAEELGITVRTLRNKLHQYGEEGDERFNIRGKKS
jgi:transcriptional regulator with PAS, ATPase and Fis domain